MEFHSSNLLAVVLGAFFVGFFKTTFSMAIGLVLVPTMVLLWPTRFILGIIAVQMWVTDFIAIRLFWRQWEGRLVKLVVPGFFIGILLGTTLLVHTPDFWLRKGIGVACLTFAGIQGWRELRGGLPAPRIGAGAGVGIGVAGGIISALFHSGGLVLSLYLLSQGLTKTPLVATIIATWIWANPVKVASYWVGGIVSPEMFLAGIAAAPIALAGGWLGKRLLEGIPQRGFNLTLLALSAATAARLLGE